MFIVFIVSFSISLLAVALILRLSHANKWFDRVNERKIHSENIPRLAGIGFATAFLLIAVVINLVFLDKEEIIRGLPCFVALLIILIFGIIDDFRPLRPRYKLLAQIVASLIVVFSGYYFRRFAYTDGGLLPQLPGYIITVLWLVGITNAINLIDGMDGLAGGISGIIALSFGLIFYFFSTDHLMVLYCIALVGVVLGFLVFNAPFPRAKIFMGDSGSQFLGFLLALLPLLCKQDSVAALPVPYAIALLLIPIFDIIAAIWRRIRDGIRIFTPDKSHVHHKLMNVGLNVRGVNAILYSLQIVIGAVVFISIGLKGRLSLYILGVAYLIIIAFFSTIHFINRSVSKRAGYKAAATPPPPQGYSSVWK
jgi:UDP-GlcNAc:undecaprenyl-phosphate GlcNAc-1-phosphate transferase